MTRARRILVAAVLIALAAAGATLWYFFAPVQPGRGGFAFAYSVPGERATIWAVGDGDASSAGRAVAERIAAGPVDRLLYLGDVYERGTARDFRDKYAPSYGRIARVTAPTPGNHDWPRHESGYDPYWERALRRDAAAAWYAFRAGGWTILSLDSETAHDRGSPQLRWLRSQLRSPGTCRIAFWHRPRYNAGTRHGDQPDMAAVWEELRGRAAIALAGHEHNMQRLRPIDGVTSFVSGSGGRSHYRLRRDDRRLAFGDDRLDGALRLTLRRGLASYAFVAADGRVLDSGSVRCRPARGRR